MAFTEFHLEPLTEDLLRAMHPIRWVLEPHWSIRSLTLSGGGVHIVSDSGWWCPKKTAAFLKLRAP